MTKLPDSSNFAGFENDEDTPPPFLGSWKRIYLAVVTYLFSLILLLYVLTIVFSYN